MSGPHPSVAAIRGAVRRALADLDPGDTLLVACSGGADSLALLAATVFEARALSLGVVGVTIDHGLQEGSDTHTAHVVAQMAALGVDETASSRVHVEGGGLGIEAAARQARYEVLGQLQEHFGARLVLLGHTRDDQAETVLLGLARGSGGRSLAGMRREFGPFVRPLLDASRDDTVTACLAEGIDYWDDPHNSDPGFARVRVRATVLPVLEEQLGPGIAEALARTADLVRDDVDALDDIAEQAYGALRTEEGLPLPELSARHRAVRSRILRMAAVDAGAIDSELFHVHVTALLDLRPGDPRQVRLPGHVTAFTDGSVLRFRRTT